LGALIADLDLKYAGIGERLLEDGALRRFINVYINDEDVRFLGGLDSQIKDGDSVTILPAVAGG
jgi:molybdopterin converting factor small subunit